jgi:hypothetical protein
MAAHAVLDPDPGLPGTVWAAGWNGDTRARILVAGFTGSQPNRGGLHQTVLPGSAVL